MRNVFKTIATVALLLFLVEVILQLLHVSAYIFPRPTDIITVAQQNAGVLFYHFMVTFIESFLGFLIANVISVALAVTAYFKPRLEHQILSAGIVIKTIPVIALTPLLIMWFGSDISSKIATAALICFFPALVNMIKGMKSLESSYYDLFKIYSTPKTKLIKLLLIPGGFPFLIASLKISSSLAVVGALVGEFIGANKGLGYLTMVNYYSFNTPMVYAAITLSSLLGLAYYYALNAAELKFGTSKSSEL
jgi:NitT/TauT family transport system permease protein